MDSYLRLRELRKLRQEIADLEQTEDALCEECLLDDEECCTQICNSRKIAEQADMEAEAAEAEIRAIEAAEAAEAVAEAVAAEAAAAEAAKLEAIMLPRLTYQIWQQQRIREAQRKSAATERRIRLFD